MTQNLYMKTDMFQSNKDMADYFRNELSIRGFNPEEPSDDDYMYSIRSIVDGQPVVFYMGKNDEESSPPLWQIWTEQQIPFLKKLFGKPDKAPEQKARLALDEITKAIDGVSGVEWAL